MADLTVPCEVETRSPRPELIRLFDIAEEMHDWETIKPFPMLLVTWQAKHQEDVMPIARWVSHHRTQTHKLCKRADCTDKNYWFVDPPVKPNTPAVIPITLVTKQLELGPTTAEAPAKADQQVQVNK